jgi:ATP-dependent RNA helicase MSS116
MNPRSDIVIGGSYKLVDVKSEPRFTQDAWKDVKFEPPIIKAVREQGKNGVLLEVMTKVQKHVALNVGEWNENLYVIAPTGSGKTIAFIAPILQGMHDGLLDSAILLSPTNPLRRQHIAVATALAGAVPVITVESDSPHLQTKLKDSRHSLSVATTEKWSKLAKVPEMKEFMKDRVSVIVLDEVDELVRNPGFFSHLNDICAACTSARILAFTATHSAPALEFVKSANARDTVHIDADDANRNNHTHEYVTVESANLLPALRALVELETGVKQHKVMIFFNTSMFAEFAHNYLKTTGCENIHILHTKMNRGAAKRSEQTFVGCTECFLLSSNVTARGMDFPNVTVVIQVGPSPPELYVQRVGRSGRGEQKGKGILLLVEQESAAMLKGVSRIEGLEIKEKSDLKVKPNEVSVPVSKSDQAFKSLIGAYNTDAKMLGWKMKDIIAVIKSVFVGAGQSVPTITAQYARKAKVGTEDGLVIAGGGLRPRPNPRTPMYTSYVLLVGTAVVMAFLGSTTF